MHQPLGASVVSTVSKSPCRKPSSPISSDVKSASAGAWNCTASPGLPIAHGENGTATKRPAGSISYRRGRGVWWRAGGGMVFFLNKIVKRKAPRKVTRRCAMTCNTEGTAVSEVATVVRNLDGIAMSGEMGNAGAMRICI
eukprot:scaffold8852_cov95-Isochrysis_galbana.AAC.1